MKRTLKVILVGLLFFSSGLIKVNANEELPSSEYYSIIDPTTLYSEKENAYYIFDTEEELQDFLFTLDNKHEEITTYACLPGDPGYPHCNDNTVVSVTSKKISTTTTGYRYSNNYLLGVNGWCYGSGTCGLTLGKTYGATFGVNHNGISGNFNFSVTVSSNYSFSVPAGYKGNIKYKCKLKVETRQYVYTLKNGKKQNGSKYNVVSIVNGTGGFEKVLVKV
ncbi:hypothetical protein QUV96_09325 [Amedibacillus dolichus]|uniref:Uncharacterized protein n=1 Tax=Amedibacillus dolichus TaxID=31971 RepID=A0ABT7UDY1_9FIRM|nr:hypothetical protein [Amedibacillus dolichus]MDM8157836.1 hypothetical protein [Amedibacillus dolichus]